MPEQVKPIIDGLWNDNILPENYGNNNLYFEHIFEQYKVFIEMADKISSRRNLTNTFFLTLHTFLIASAGFIFENWSQTTNLWLNIFPLIAVLILCYTWWRLIKSYRQLNSAKYKVIGEYERRLPSSPYWSAEWHSLGEGKDAQLYEPLTNVEDWIPAIFAFMYVIGAIAIAII